MKYLKVLICLVAAVFFMFGTGISKADEIVLGYTGPLSGPAAEYGQDILYGVDMAVNEINAPAEFRLAVRSTPSNFSSSTTGSIQRRP